MEKAILKTLLYSDIFDYPLTIFEIHKWLIGRKSNLRQVEESVGRLKTKGTVLSVKGYCVLSKRNSLVKKRLESKYFSKHYFRKAYLISFILKVIPWIKLVGISGGLAMDNAGKMDDIDLFIITSKKRLWISRLFILGILEGLGQRRRVSDSKKQAAGKICCNLILEEDKLEQVSKNLFTAHEVLQMKVLWQRGNVYHKFLEDNEWVFKFLPNWIATNTSLRAPKGRGNLDLKKSQDSYVATFLGMTLEKWAKNFQLRVMQTPKGQERIEEGALYFHPEDYGQKILAMYDRRSELRS